MNISVEKIRLPIWLGQYIVDDVKSVDEFLNKYSKTYNNRDKFYRNAMFESHTDHFKENGYDFISRFDSITGIAVAIVKKAD